MTDPDPGAEPPTTRSVIAVCGGDDEEALGGQEEEEERPYLLLDRDRRVFDEYEERAEDVELLRDEVRRMQETEVQVFVDTLKMQQSLMVLLPQLTPHLKNLVRAYLIHRRNMGLAYLIHRRNVIRDMGLAYLIHRRNIIHGNIYAIRKKGAKGMAKGAIRRSSGLYRRIRARNKELD